MTWTEADGIAARAQGWDIFDVWEGFMLSEIQKYDALTTFATDEAARDFVRVRAADSPNHDSLCHKAWVIVFRSKLGVPRVKPKRKTA